jgi:hypothetical protein
MKKRAEVFLLFLVVVCSCGSGKSSKLEGKVVDGKGQPMVNLKMIAKQVQPIKGFEQFEAETGSDGTFRFKKLFPTSEYVISPWSNVWRTEVKLTVETVPQGETLVLPSPIVVRFIISKEDVITDLKTGFEWYVGPDRNMNWNESRAWVQSLSVAGSGWRMPNRKELNGLYQKGAGKINIDPIFKISGRFVYSGDTKLVQSPWGSEALDFDFRHGEEGWISYTGHRGAGSRAFAVRSRK